MYPLINLLVRILSGEQFRKATPTELRWYSAGFLFLPIYLVGFVRLGHSFLDRASAGSIWLFMMASFLMAGTVLYTWVRFIPAAVSWMCGAVVWAATLFLAFTNRLF
jgi:hypothetical protein